MQFIIVRFDGICLQYYGPFDNREAADIYSNKKWACDSHVIRLTK